MQDRGDNSMRNRVIVFFMMAAVILTSLIGLTSCDADLFGAKTPVGISMNYTTGKYTAGTVIEFGSLKDASGKLLTFNAEVKLKGGDTSEDVSWRILRWTDKVSTDAVSGGKVSVVGRTTGKELSFYINAPGTYEVIAYASSDENIRASSKITVGGSIESIGIIADGSASEITSTLTLYVKDSVILRPSYHPADTTQTAVDWSMETNSYFSMTKLSDGKGVVLTGLSAGTAQITVTCSDARSISKTIGVRVLMSGDSQSFAPSTITVDPAPNTLTVGSVTDITATVLDEHGNEYSQGNVVFTSSNPSAVSVSQLSSRAARLVASGSGSATIKAEVENDSSVWKSFPVSVTGAVESLSLSSGTYRLLKGETITAGVTFTPTGTVQKGLTVSSSDSSIASVSLSGSVVIIKAVGKGEATVTVSSSANSSARTTAKVIVSETLSAADKVQRIEVTPAAYEFDGPTGTVTISATQFNRDDAGNITSADASCTWSVVSGAECITGTVNGSRYIVNAKKPGTAVVRATSPLNPEIYAEAVITVGGVLKSLIPASDSMTLRIGEKADVNVTVYPATAVYDGLAATVSDSSVLEASIRKVTGGTCRLTLNALAQGTSKVAISADGRQMAEITVTVQPADPVKVRSIGLSSSSIAMKQDADPIALMVTSYDGDGNECEGDFTYQFIGGSSDIVGITRSADVLFLSPRNAGIATLLITSADNEGVSATCRIEVGGAAVQGDELRAVRMPYDGITIGRGSRVTVTAGLIPSTATASLMWSSSEASVVSAEKGGSLDAVLFGQNVGTATVTATDTNTGRYASLRVTVVEDAAETDTRIAKTEINDGKTILKYTSSTGNLTLSAKALMADNTVIEGESFRWFVSSPDGNVRLVTPENGTGETATIRWNGFDSTAPTVITVTPVRNPNAASQVVICVSDGRQYDELVVPASLSVTLEKGKETTVAYGTLNPSGGVTATSTASAVNVSASSATVRISASDSGTAVLSTPGASAEIRVYAVDKAERLDTSIASVSLDRAYLSYDIAKKALQKITATVRRVDGTVSTTDGVRWESSDESIITITQNDSVSATVKHTGKLGTATITAVSVGNPAASASCYVEVIDSSTKAETLRAVTLSSSSMTLETGRSATLTASTTPTSLSGTTVFKWNSSNPNVVSVSDGRVTAMAPGSAIITVTAAGTNVSDSCRITVVEPEATTPKAARIELSSNVISLSQEYMDRAGMITASVIDTAGNVMQGETVTWNCPGGTIAEITTSGNSLMAYPKSSGTVLVTATYGKFQAHAMITVGAKATSGSTDATGLVLSSSSVRIATGSTMNVNAYTVPGGLEEGIAWSSSDEGVAVVSGTGSQATILAKAAGTCTVSAVLSAENRTLRADMTVTVATSVKNEVSELRLDKTSLLMDMNEKVLTTVTATAYVNGSAVTNQKITWTLEGLTANELGYSTIDTNGRTVSVVKKGVGSGWLVAKASNGVSAKCYVEIIDSTEQDVPVQRIVLDRSAVTLATGETQQVKATAVPDTASDTRITWSTSDDGKVTVTQDGKITGVSAGTATITASSVRYGVSAECTVTVLPPSEPEITPASVTLSTAYVQLRQDVSEPKMLSATVIGSNGSVMSGAQVDWTVSVDGIIETDIIGNTMWISPADTGKTIVTATCGGASASCLVVSGTGETAAAEMAEKLIVIPSSAVVQKGKYQPVVAGPYPAGIAINPVWVTSNAGIVGLTATDTSSAVLVYGKGLGNATVTATDRISEQSAESLITVMNEEDIKDEVTSILLSRTSVTLDLAEKDLVSVKATVYVNGTPKNDIVVNWEYVPETGASDAVVVYTDSNFRQTASVAKNAEGTGMLRATVDGSQMFGQCYVKVIDSTDSPITLSGLRLTTDAMTMSIGSQTTLRVMEVPAGAKATVRWSSSDDSVATVNDGVVTALKGGQTVIRAYASEKPAIYDECTVTVTSGKNAQAGSVELSSAIVRLMLNGAGTTITATVRDTEGVVMPSANLWWDVEGAEGIAEFRKNGNSLEVSPLNAGTAKITAYTYNASLEKVSSEATVIVGAAMADKLTGLGFDSSEPVYLVIDGEERSVGPVYSPDKPSLHGVLWSGNSPSFSYSVKDEKAVLRGMAVGEGSLTATTVKNPEGENISASIRVITVATEDDLPEVTSLRLSRSALSFDLADKALVSLTATPYNYSGEPVTGKTVNWKVEQTGTSLEILETQNGTVQIAMGSSTGTAKITAECLGIEATCMVTVIDSTVAGTAFQGISFTTDNVTMKVGTTAYAELEAYPAAMAETPTWEVTDGQDVITVSRTNDEMIAIVRAVKAGTAVLTATMNIGGEAWKASCTYRVTEDAGVTLASIEFEPAWLSLSKPGDVGVLQAVLKGTDGNPYPGTVSFAYIGEGIISATPSSGNRVTVEALSEGTAWLRATLGGLEARACITVGAVEGERLTALTLTPSKVTMKAGQTRDITVTAVPDTAMPADFEVTTSDDSVVTGSYADGRLTLTAVGTGNGAVTVRSGSVSATVSVSVSGQAVPSYMKMDPSVIELTQEAGDRAPVSAYVYDADGYRLQASAFGGIAWTVDDMNVVSLSADTGDTVTVQPVSYGHAVITASCGNVSVSGSVSVADAGRVSQVTAPTALALDYEQITIGAGAEVQVTALYSPVTLAEEYRGLAWKSSDTTVVTAESAGVGKGLIRAIGPGSAVVTATSTDNPNLKVTVNVRVVEPGVDWYLISLDRKQARIALGSSTDISAALMKNGEAVTDGTVLSQIAWKLTLAEEWGSNPAEGDAPFIRSTDGGTAIVSGGGKAGYAYLTAEYGDVSAKTMIEVYDPSSEGEKLRSVVLSQHSITLETGEYYDLTASVMPELPGIRYAWVVSEGADAEGGPIVTVGDSVGYRNWVVANRPGSAKVRVTATAEDGTSVSDEMEIRVVDGINAIGKYSGITIVPQTLDIRTGSTAIVTGTLYEAGSDKGSAAGAEEQLSWRILGSDGTVFWDSADGGDVDEESPVRPYGKGMISLSSFEITATKPGYAYVESYFKEKVGVDSSGEPIISTVASRAFVEVTGDARSATLSSSVYHLTQGEQVKVTASVIPATALYEGKWQVLDSTGAESDAIAVYYETDNTVTLTARKSDGQYRLIFTATDTAGNAISAEAKVYLHDQSYGKGGISYISFASPVSEAVYPWSETQYPVYVHYIDGTVKTMTPDLFSEIETRSGSFKVEALNADGSVTEVTPENGRIVAVTGKDTGTWKTFIPLNMYAVAVTPVQIGSSAELRLTCTFTQDGTEYGCSTVITADRTFTLSLSSTGISLYTGGSAVLEAQAYLDGEARGGVTYSWKLMSETTSRGEKVVQGATPSGSDTSTGTSIFTADSTSGSGPTFTIGTKGMADSVLVKPAGDAREIIWASDNDILYSDLTTSFPRTARFLVEAKDAEGNIASEYVDVTVRRLPEGYTYPQGITLSTTKLTLSPPFTDEQTISATVSDIEGKSIDATVEWWYTAVTEEGLRDEFQLKGDQLTMASQSRDSIEAYMQPNGSTVYFRPLKAGVYRMTARVRQNPQISATAVFSISGDVTGIKADTGNSLVVTKGSWADINAIYTPEENLARDMFWAIGTPKDDGTYSWYLMKNGNYNVNGCINFKANGTTGSVYGKLATNAANQPEVCLVYAKDTVGQGAIEKHLETGHDIKSIDGQKMYLTDDTAVDVFTYSVTVDVEATKTVYSFRVEGTTEVDPDAVSGAVLTYNISASSSNNKDAAAFDDWDWTEAKLIGSETGKVYASSVPVNGEGKSLYKGLYKPEAPGEDEIEMWYTSEQLTRNSDGTFTSDDKGVDAKSDLKYYNSSRTVRRFVAGLSEDVKKVCGTTDLSTLWKVDDGVKTELSGITLYQVQTDASSSAEYVIINGTQYRTDDVGRVYGIDNSGKPYYIGKTADIEIEAPLSSFENGKLMASNEGQTYTISLSKGNIPVEPLVFKTGLSELVSGHNTDSDYYDPEMNGYRDSDQVLYVGGKIVSLGPGESTIKNNATTTTTTTGGLIDLNEGGSAVLRLSYNPTYTHQKDVKWEVVYATGGITNNTSFSVTPSQDGTELLFDANKIDVNRDSEEVHIRATSVADPSVSYTFTVTIRCIVKNVTFQTKTVNQLNKADKYATPKYKVIADEIYPWQETDNVVVCYDYTDVSGASGMIDGYEITLKPTPEYGYEFTTELVSGSSIGEINMTDIDTKENKFRFIPKGRVYSNYLEDGTPDGSYEVTYGDAVIRISCSALNYSRDFTVRYTDSTSRVVRAIDETKGEDYRKLWDMVEYEEKPVIYGLECIVMHVGDEFPVTMIDTLNKGAADASIQKAFRVPGKNGWNPVLGWSMSTEDKKFTSVDGGDKFLDENGNENSSLKEVIEYSAVGGDKSDPRGEEEGLFGHVCTITAKKEGKYWLNYTMIDGGEDKDVNGNPIYKVIHGSIPVYVISDVDQSLAASLVSLGKSSAGLIPEKISKANLDKWYLPSSATSATDDKGTVISNQLYRGRAYMVFDGDYDSKTGLQNINETIDFTELTEAHFKAINENPSFCFPVEDDQPKEIEGNVTRTFSKAGFDSILMTGKRGVSKLSSKSLIIVGLNDKFQNDETKYNDICKGWIKRNKSTENNLDFSGTEKLEFKRINFSGSKILFSESLSYLKMEECTYTTDLEFKKCDTLGSLSIINGTMGSVTLSSNKGLNNVKLSGVNGKNLKLETLGTTDSPVALSFGSLIFDTINVSGITTSQFNMGSVNSGKVNLANVYVYNEEEDPIINVETTKSANITLDDCNTYSKEGNVSGGIRIASSQEVANNSVTVSNCSTSTLVINGANSSGNGFKTITVSNSINTTVETIDARNNPKATSVTVSGLQTGFVFNGAGSGDTDDSTLTFKGCGATNDRFTLVNAGNFKTLGIGADGNTLSYPENITLNESNSKVSTMVLNGVNMQGWLANTITVNNPDLTFEIKDGNNTVSTIDLSGSGSAYSSLTFEYDCPEGKKDNIINELKLNNRTIKDDENVDQPYKQNLKVQNLELLSSCFTEKMFGKLLGAADDGKLDATNATVKINPDNKDFSLSTSANQLIIDKLNFTAPDGSEVNRDVAIRSSRLNSLTANGAHFGNIEFTRIPELYTITMNGSRASSIKIPADATKLTHIFMSGRDDKNKIVSNLTFLEILSPNIQYLSLPDNPRLGCHGWTIGSFAYTPEQNVVIIDNYKFPDNGYLDVTDPGTGYGRGHRLESGKTYDWTKWINGLTYLDMSGCNIKFMDWGKKVGYSDDFFGYTDSWWEEGGAETKNFSIRSGVNASGDEVCVHKIYAKESLSYNTIAEIKNNGSSVYYTKFLVRNDPILKIKKLNNSEIKPDASGMYSLELTNYLNFRTNGDYCFVIYPFGK